MATKKKRFRIESLSRQDQDALGQLDNVYPGLQDYIEQNGKLPDNLPVDVAQSLGKSVIDKLPNQETAYSNFLKTQEGKDEANLSDQELQDRLQAYQGLEGITKSSTVRDIPKLTDDIAKRIRKEISDKKIGGISEIQVNNAAALMANRLANGQGENLDLNFAETFARYGDVGNDAFKQLREIGGRITTETANILNQGTYFKTTDSTLGNPEDTKRVQSILADRGFIDAEQARVSALENDIPELLRKNREQYYGGERARVKDYVTGEAAPQIIQQLNRRGLADSGQAGVSIQNKYLSMLGTVNEAEMNQAIEEANFWADQKYKNTFDQLIAARTGVSSTVENARQDAMTKSQQGFTKSQQKIQDQFNIDLFKSENERALDQYNKQLSLKNKQAQDQRNAQLASDITGTATTVVGLSLIG